MGRKAHPQATHTQPGPEPSPPCRLQGWGSLRLPLPHSLAQGASPFGLLLHPLPEGVSIIPVDIDLAVHVELHPVVLSKCLDLSVVPGLLRGHTGTVRVSGPP